MNFRVAVGAAGAALLVATIGFFLLTSQGHNQKTTFSAQKPEEATSRPSMGRRTSHDGEIPRYGVFELTLTASGDYPNPYLKMPADDRSPGFVTGTFTEPGGAVFQVDGFWDGGKTWKLRMAPSVVGKWTYSTTSSDPGLNGKRGSFNCVSSKSKGFLRVDPAHPHHLMWDDGTPFYWAPVTLMVAHFDDRGAQGGHRRVDDNSFQTLAAARASQGFDTAFWGYYGFNKPQFNEHTQENEGGSPFTNYDPDKLNPAYYQYGDLRVKILLDQGIVPQLTLGWPDQGIESHIGNARLTRLWRYLIARYSAYNIVYNLFGEAQEFGSNYMQLLGYYGKLTRKYDPYDHLISTHTAGNLSADLIRMRWMDYITLQRPAAMTSNYLKYNKPVLNAEYFGYEHFQVNGEELRPMIWDIRMRNGYYVYESWGDDLHSSGAKYAALVNAFFRDHTTFQLLESHAALFGGRQGLANPGKEYVVYLPKGGTINVDLSAGKGTYSVEWYNPRTGDFASAQTVRGGEVRSFNAPDEKDWVLHLIQNAAR